MYNLLGAQVAELHHGPLTGGILTFSAPATLATGVYFVQLRDRTIAETRKVIFLK